MKLAIMQPYIFPYIGYFQLINAVDKFVVLDDVNYINRGWINRNNLLVNGKSNLFTIPLKDPSQNKLINEIYISEDIKWKSKFLKTIELNYKKAPCFSKVYSITEEIVNSSNKISELNHYALIRINEYLGIKTEIVSTSSTYQNNNLRAQSRIIDICRIENASVYINPIGGMEIYSRDEFKKNELDLYFLKSGDINYKQLKNEFVPWLSIIDVMMFNIPEEIKVLLNRVELL